MRIHPQHSTLLQFKIFDPFIDVEHFSTTRRGGVSTGEFKSLNLGNFSDDNPLNIFENRSLLAQKYFLQPEDLITPHQTHGSEVLLIDQQLLSSEKSEIIEKLYGIDATITNERGIFLCVTTADCVPILLYDTKNSAIAAIHAGWRGTVGRIVEKTIDKMKLHFGTQTADLIVAIGPAIGIDNYEVGKEVEEIFKENGFHLSKPLSFRNPKTQKIHLDVKEINRQELIRLGVPTHQIEKTKYDTYKNKRLFFSARRQTVHSGRMLSGIMLKK